MKEKKITESKVLNMDVFVGVSETINGLTPGFQKLFGALVLLICIDYITGVCVAFREKKLSSKIGAKGLASKIMILGMVALSVVIDYMLTDGSLFLRNITTLFYCTNELISICENATKMGLPLPEKLQTLLRAIKAEKKQQASSEDKDDPIR